MTKHVWNPIRYLKKQLRSSGLHGKGFIHWDDPCALLNMTGSTQFPILLKDTFVSSLTYYCCWTFPTFSYNFVSMGRIFASYQNNQAKVRRKHKSCFPLLSMLCFLLTVCLYLGNALFRECVSLPVNGTILTTSMYYTCMTLNSLSWLWGISHFFGYHYS